MGKKAKQNNSKIKQWCYIGDCSNTGSLAEWKDTGKLLRGIWPLLGSGMQDGVVDHLREPAEPAGGSVLLMVRQWLVYP
jgi:hypothetical protein